MNKMNSDIALFMSLKLITKDEFNKLGEQAYTDENKDVKWGIIEYLKYHQDWQELMPVVEKIESLGYRFIIVKDEADIESTYDNPIQKNFGTYSPDGTKIGAVYQAVLSFIKWYSNLKG